MLTVCVHALVCHTFAHRVDHLAWERPLVKMLKCCSKTGRERTTRTLYAILPKHWLSKSMITVPRMELLGAQHHCCRYQSQHPLPHGPKLSCLPQKHMGGTPALQVLAGQRSTGSCTKAKTDRVRVQCRQGELLRMMLKYLVSHCRIRANVHCRTNRSPRARPKNTRWVSHLQVLAGRRTIGLLRKGQHRLSILCSQAARSAYLFGRFPNTAVCLTANI